jgi:ribosomal protein L32
MASKKKRAASSKKPAMADVNFCSNCGHSLATQAERAVSMDVATAFCPIHGELLRSDRTCPEADCPFHTTPVPVAA